MFIEVEKIELEYDLKYEIVINTNHITSIQKHLVDYTLLTMADGRKIVINKQYELFKKKFMTKNISGISCKSEYEDLM